MSTTNTHIAVSGDAPLQLFLLPTPSSGRDGDTAGARGHWIRGGAGILAKLLSHLHGFESRVHVHKPTFTITAEESTGAHIRSIFELDPAFSRLTGEQRLGAPPSWHAPETPLPGVVDGSALVWLLQDADAENSFTEEQCKMAIRAIHDARPRLLVYHMSRPLCEGSLWDDMRRGPYIGEVERDPDRLVVIVSAEDLRLHGVELSHGLSWERTCQDFVERLGSVGSLVTLCTSAHLIVLFGSDGAIYHRGRQAAGPRLFFDPLCVEGEFARQHLGPTPGAAEAFVAGFVKGLARSRHLSIEESVEPGLWAVRRLSRYGPVYANPFYEASGIGNTGESGRKEGRGGPVEARPAPDIMGKLGEKDEDGAILRFSIPSDNIASRGDADWSLIDHMIGDPAEVARQIVKFGVNTTAGQVPMTRFNSLVVFDRQEIESFRTLFDFLREYLSAPQNRRPLSIALCGPKGSGKAFSALQVAASALGEEKFRELRFDLSQFTSRDDLISAFHSVRDCNLEGAIPLVYFSGFDCPFSGTLLGWLPHLLPAMLRGRFSDHGDVNRPIGRAVFFFGTAVFTSYHELEHQSKLKGTPTVLRDFLNCLHGFVEVLGPNEVKSGRGIDRLYPIRRAVIIRALLEQREPNLTRGPEGKLDIDYGVLNSLLLTPQYQQGIRSLKSIIAMSRLNGRHSFERAALPPPSQLSLHVDYDTFMEHKNGFPIPRHIREEVAKRLHETYLAAKLRIFSVTEKPWNELSQELKESSRAHADSIPYKLGRVFCFLSEAQEHHDAVQAFTEDEIDFLGELEHDRWNAERLQKQWRLGERSVEQRKTPFLTPWGDMEKDWQDIDRAMVRSYPTILVPYRVYRMRRTVC